MPYWLKRPTLRLPRGNSRWRRFGSTTTKSRFFPPAQDYDCVLLTSNATVRILTLPMLPVNSWNRQGTMGSLRCFAIRLLPGQEIKGTLLKFVEEHELKAAFVLSCVGSVRCAKLRLADDTKVLEINEECEIVSFVGTLSAGGHLHASLSDRNGKVVGGHVLGNMIVFTTAEVVIGDCKALNFTREMDPNTGFKELVVKKL